MLHIFYDSFQRWRRALLHSEKKEGNGRANKEKWGKMKLLYTFQMIFPVIIYAEIEDVEECDKIWKMFERWSQWSQ